MSQPISTKTKTFKLAGITMSGYDRETLYEGMPVKLVRERENAYDPNAIQVRDTHGVRIAYLPKAIAAVLAPRIDAKQLRYRASLVLVPDGDLTVWGIKFEYYLVQDVA